MHRHVNEINTASQYSNLFCREPFHFQLSQNRTKIQYIHQITQHIVGAITSYIYIYIYILYIQGKSSNQVIIPFILKVL